LEQHIGDVFEGVVSAVTSFGLFVELSDIYVEGLVHVSALDSDYYHFDQAKQRLIGERTRRSFHLGDSLTVKVVRVNLDDKKIDLEVVKKPTRGSRRSSKKALKKSPIQAKSETKSPPLLEPSDKQLPVADTAKGNDNPRGKNADEKKHKAKKTSDKKRLSRVKRDKLVKKKAAKKSKSGKVAAADKLLAKVRKRKAKK
jgi:ribonuclease R